jgi:hypothetical protein
MNKLQNIIVANTEPRKRNSIVEENSKPKHVSESKNEMSFSGDSDDNEIYRK